MPQIIKDDKQEAALQQISAGLDELKTINAILSAGDYSFRLQSIGGGKGRVDIGQPLADKIAAVLRERKRILVRDMKATAKNFRIGFSDEDNYVMSDASSAAQPQEQNDSIPETESQMPEAGSEPIEEPSDPGNYPGMYGQNH